MQRINRGFTLVEILIVVVILGIIAAITVPQYASATQEASEKSAVHEVQRLRKAVEVYLTRHANVLPDVAEEMTRRGPKAVLRTDPDCGHAPALNNALQLAWIIDFLT